MSGLFPCRGCGRPYSTVDPKTWHIDPAVCKECCKQFKERNMFMAYDTIFEACADNQGQAVTLRACNSGLQNGIMVALDTGDFRVEYQDGKAHIYLARHLTIEQARELGKQLIAAADSNDELQKQYVTVSG